LNLPDSRFTVNSALDAIARSHDDDYGVLLKHGTLEVGFYKPDKIDPQHPHARDEVYVVQSGSGKFVVGDKQQSFVAGDALFVPAGVEHRFVDFSNDFATWVIFYGPNGGESA
jgi:mannose-6-phosphate isomerase-like protein (cupin superfamily)